MVEEGPLCVFQTQISPEDLHEHANPSLLVEYENDEQHCNQSQHIEKPAVCDEELKYEEKEQGSQLDVSFCFSNSEIFCQEEIFFLDPIEKQNVISFEMHEKNEVVK